MNFQVEIEVRWYFSIGFVSFCFAKPNIMIKQLIYSLMCLFAGALIAR